ncbi:MAG: 2-dehydropantoate 2-reductase, partial [Caldimonas sp.]
MKIAVVGLGAIGGLVAARLALAGHDVCGVARGATLDAVRSDGLRLRIDGSEKTATLRVSSDARELGPQDLVVIAFKGPALIESAAALRPLLQAGTIVLPAMNGVPWWFLQAAPTALPSDVAGEPLASVDPGGRIAATLPLAQVLGCVVHLTCSTPEPGVVQHGFGNRLVIGEPAGGQSSRTKAVCELLSHAGFTTEASADIRND